MGKAALLSEVSQYFLNVPTVNMKVLWFFILLHVVFAETQFGTSYLNNSSRLCIQWTCINNKLNLPNGLPLREQYADVLKSLLPIGWQQTVEKVLQVCYVDRPRRYTNTCPGQALLHCTVDQLIQNCPEDSLRKDDACAPVTSLAGFKYMFSQSRYTNLEKNLPSERRPAWFLKNYFSSKCCNLPELFSTADLTECGFNTMINYHVHEPAHSNNPTTAEPSRFDQVQVVNINNKVTTEESENDRVQVVDINSQTYEQTTPDPNNVDSVKVVNLDDIGQQSQDIDPLDCCDLSPFIQPSWRSECGFQVSWDEDNRLIIKNNSNTVTSTTTAVPSTTAAMKSYDVKILPQSCEKEICVFSKLGIVSSGKVDLIAFSKLLDNMTNVHNSWTKTKARVVTKCLTKPITDYVDDCEINKVLACTFDILSENCPHAKKHDPCRHTNILRNDMTCQISSSKYRPKSRRQFCGIPNLVNHEVLMQCGITSITRMEYVSEPPTPRPVANWWKQSRFSCKGSTASTKCLLNKMGVLNKYGFSDYFKMKDRIRMFKSQQPAWSSLVDVYLNAFALMPLYDEQCSTPKKLLNVLDSMLTTCPISKRKSSVQCNRILTDVATTTPNHKQQTREKLVDSWRKHYLSYFRRIQIDNIYNSKVTVTHTTQSAPVTHKNPIYNGFLGLDNAPPVQILDLKTTTYRPLVLLPVYLRTNYTPVSMYRNYLQRRGVTPLNRDIELAEQNFMRM